MVLGRGTGGMLKVGCSLLVNEETSKLVSYDAMMEEGEEKKGAYPPWPRSCCLTSR